MSIFLSDVDGCVAGLMQGFSQWMWDALGMNLPVEDISLHSELGRSPKLASLNELVAEHYPDRFGPDGRNTPIGRAFLEFMALPDCYQHYVPVLPGSQEALAEIGAKHDVVFVTANMKTIPQSYVTKYRWLTQHFPNIPVVTCPSDLKQIVGIGARYAVDDRWDICQRWGASGTGNVQIRSLCLRQPWNEAPEGAELWTWDAIADFVTKPKRGEFQGEF